MTVAELRELLNRHADKPNLEVEIKGSLLVVSWPTRMIDYSARPVYLEELGARLIIQTETD